MIWGSDAVSQLSLSATTYPDNIEVLGYIRGKTETKTKTTSGIEGKDMKRLEDLNSAAVGILSLSWLLLIFKLVSLYGNPALVNLLSSPTATTPIPAMGPSFTWGYSQSRKYPSLP